MRLRSMTLICVCAFAFCCAAFQARCAAALAQAGYAVLPAPQRVSLRGGEFRVGADWRIERGPGVSETDVAVEALTDGFSTRHAFRFAGVVSGANSGDAPAVRLTIRAGSVPIGPAQDSDKDALAAQAYRLDLGEHGIQITANDAPGLFYGTQTLVQLARRRDGAVWLPAGEITDWPDLQLRELYWDDAHHLERLEALKQAVRQAAFFKINGFVLKLDGHFQYRHAPALVEPQALSREQMQELTDYALRYHVQLIPYLDAPAHVAFILKHPEYADMRAFPDSNYELCTANPKICELLFGMFQDLLDANKGGRYFYLSTDEPYYLGMADAARCDEAARQREGGSPGKVLAEFLTKTAGYLHDRGRTVVFWGEHPLKPADVQSLPAYLVNGETGGAEFDAAFKARGIRQMLYTSTEGEEKFFPDYFVLPAERRLHPPAADSKPRVGAAVEAIASDPARRNGDLMGVFVAGWADMGLHPETFWLGYATIAAAGWNPAATAGTAPAPEPSARGAMADFYPLFYGPSVQKMDRVYQLMSFQAQRWADSWETAPSEWRKPIWGNSHEIYRPRHAAQDQVLTLPSAAEPGRPAWARDNAKRLELAEEGILEGDELLGLLRDNLQRAEFNRYNLEVFLSLAQLCRHNLQLIRDIARMDGLASTASAAAEKDPAAAVAAWDEAIDVARSIRRQRNEVLRDATQTWYKTWLPRVPEANGRKFLHELDDVKDHLPDRTVGMEYLIYRELNLPMGQWVGRIRTARDACAKAHNLPESVEPFDWGGT